ncbi:MAG: chloride channel protein [Clostridia bacterium]|nr:chloride channel protein [Clostridia bacterium]
MKSGIRNHLVNIMMPAVVFSAIVGVITGAVVFAFRIVSEKVIELSHEIFSFAGENPWAIPLVVLGAVLIALLVSLCIVYSPHSKGGGIPTAVALMRGLITFDWLRNLIFVFTSALFSYICGIPLGNDEGPAVQLGTAVGSGTTQLLAKKHRGWERYLMTGGATAGFAVATCAPVSAVLFGMEEAHRRISPLLIMSSLTSVMSGMCMLRWLCHLTGMESELFHFGIHAVLPLNYLWIVGIVGIICGIFAWLLVKGTLLLRKAKRLRKLHPFFRLAPVFAAVVLVGCFFYEGVGTGHHLIETLIEQRTVWYMALILLAVRSVLVLLSYDAGATGGLFTPLLVFGALIGSMVGELMVAIGWMDPVYLPVMVVIGMAGILASAARIPLTAAVFSIEAFSGFENILSILVSILVAYVTVEIIGVTSVNEIAMEREVHKQHKGKTRKMVDVELTVMPGSFAIGKEPRDILWPSFCHVLSVREGEEDEKDSYEGGAIHPGDILRLNFTTFDPEATARELCNILGEQPVYAKADIEEDPDEGDR